MLWSQRAKQRAGSTEVMQGRGSGEAETAAARLGAGDEDPGEDDVLQRGGDGLGCRGAEVLSDELLLLDADRGSQGTELEEDCALAVEDER